MPCSQPVSPPISGVSREGPFQSALLTDVTLAGRESGRALDTFFAHSRFGVTLAVMSHQWRHRSSTVVVPTTLTFGAEPKSVVPWQWRLGMLTRLSMSLAVLPLLGRSFWLLVPNHSCGCLSYHITALDDLLSSPRSSTSVVVTQVPLDWSYRLGREALSPSGEHTRRKPRRGHPVRPTG